MKYGCNMTAAQAIKELECIKFGITRRGGNSFIDFQDAIARDAGLDYAMDMLNEIVKGTMNYWVPYSERMPPRDLMPYDVTVEFNTESPRTIKRAVAVLQYYGNGVWQRLEGYENTDYKITAWKERPRPWEGERNG